MLRLSSKPHPQATPLTAVSQLLLCLITSTDTTQDVREGKPRAGAVPAHAVVQRYPQRLPEHRGHTQDCLEEEAGRPKRERGRGREKVKGETELLLHRMFY